MKTVLDLLSEYGALSDTKIRRGGSLAPADEERWEELKAFYDHLMSQKGLPLSDHDAPFSESELRHSVAEHERLRVPLERYAILRLEDVCLEARVVNLSRGGAFLGTEKLLPVGSRPAVYLSETEPNEGTILEVEARVTWCSESGVPEAGLPRGMGIRFLEPEAETQARIDNLLLTSIETQLSRLW